VKKSASAQRAAQVVEIQDRTARADRVSQRVARTFVLFGGTSRAAWTALLMPISSDGTTTDGCGLPHAVRP
jgi:hypothetical protein